MSVWDDVRPVIASGDQRRLVAALRGLGPEERRTVADALPGYLRSERSRRGWINAGLAYTLLLAGVATIGGPAAAATWAARSDLRGWSGDSRSAKRLAGLVAEVLGHRTPEWRAEFARRVGEGLRPNRVDEEQSLWHITARLTREAGLPPPDGDAFVLGWIRWAVDRMPGPGDLACDPYLDTLTPRLFEADGVGALLQWEAGLPESQASWGRTLAILARDGRLKRDLLLDGCVRRFLRGGRPQDLRWFVWLHDLLEPTPQETAARLRDYLRLLPAASGPVADVAFREVRRADEDDPLAAGDFTEAAEALLFRPEKKLVRAALVWMGRTARARGRVDATLCAAATAFAHEDLDLRERAVKLAVRHAAKAADEARHQVREAAVDLPADLRALVAESCGPLDAPSAPPPPAGPPPYSPRPAPVPIASPAELAEELAAQARGTREWADTERLLAGLVEHAHRDPGGTREALARVVPDAFPWAEHVNDPLDTGHLDGGLAAGARAIVWHHLGHARSTPMSAFLRDVADADRDPAFERFRTWRIHAAVQAVGRAPVLLATPTEADGHVDPDVLVERMALLEEAGVKPSLPDLNQALLRVPRDIGADAVRRARGFTSPAGRIVAGWLGGGGLPPLDVTCAPLTLPRPTYLGYPTYRTQDVPATRVLATVTLPDDTPEVISRLCRLPQTGTWTRLFTGWLSWTGWWPSALPSQREVVAAHLLPYLPETVDDRAGQGATLLALSEADGPAGPATATALAYGLAARHRDERSAATDALLTFCSRGRLSGRELGTALATAVTLENLKLKRITEALTDAARAGAHAEIWDALAAALPGLLPTGDERPLTGLPDLVALATQCAETVGARTTIPELAPFASRPATGRLVREAARLHRTLTGPGR